MSMPPTPADSSPPSSTPYGGTSRSGSFLLAPADPEEDEAEATEAENGPDYRLFQGDGDLAREIGAAWARTGEKAGEYFSVLIDDPMLAQPIRANLFRNGESSVWSLQWSRPPKRNGTA